MQLLRQGIVQCVVVEALTNGLEDCIGSQFEGFPGGEQAAVFHAGAGEAHAAYVALVIQQHFFGLCPG